MKKNHRLNIVVALGLLAFAVSNLSAAVVQTVTITATALFDSPHGPVTNGNSVLIPPPVRKSVTTKDVLRSLAQDENTAGLWPSNSFPAGVQLVIVDGEFRVIKGVINGTNLSFNVSNILSVSNPGVNEVTSGSYTVAHGPGTPPFSETHARLSTLTYDSTHVGGITQFTLTGIGVSTTTALAPNPITGAYLETRSASIQNGTGEGMAPNGIHFLLSGTASATGMGKVIP